MGIEQAIKEMSPKKIGLFMNIITVMFLFTIIYAMINLMLVGDVIKFLQTSVFVYVVLALFFLYLAWSMLSKGTKGNRGNKPKKRQKVKSSRRYKRPVSTPVGSWRCPDCGMNVIGNECPKCGFRTW